MQLISIEIFHSNRFKQLAKEHNTKILEMQENSTFCRRLEFPHWLVWMFDNVLCSRFQFKVEICFPFFFLFSSSHLQWHSFKSNRYTFFNFFIRFCIRLVELLSEWQKYEIESVFTSRTSNRFRIKRISEDKMWRCRRLNKYFHFILHSQ